MAQQYVVNEIRTENAPVVQQSILCLDWEQALDIAVKIIMGYGPPDDKATVRKELDVDGFYTAEKHSDWSVCINEVEFGTQLLVSGKK